MDDNFLKPDKSASEVQKVMKYATRDGLKTPDVQEIYEKWAESYDQDYETINYTSPLILASHVESMFPAKRDVRILDVAAGTGLVGKHLYEKGYQNLDALDASGDMLAKAKEKGCYNQLYEAFLGKTRLDIPDGRYDAVVNCGSFLPGHLNEDCYEELIRITKQGGLIFILMNQRYFKDSPEYSKNLEPRMLELQEEGVWQRVMKKGDIANYHSHHLGVLFVLRKC